MKTLSNPSRLLAFLTAGVLSAGVMLHPAPARADKAKTYKYGAIALGAVGAYLLSKGKTVAGAAVLGAGAYTYKKGEDTRKADKYDNYRYGYRGKNGNSYNNGSYNNGNYNNGSYNNGNRYGDSRYDNRYDNSYDQSRDNVPARNRLSDRDNNGNSSYRAYRSDEYRDDDRYENRNDARHNDRSHYNSNHPKMR